MSFDRLSLFPISLSPGVRHGPSGAPEASRCELPGPCTHQHEPFQPAPGAEACGRARRESDDGDLQRRTSVTSLSQMNSQTSASSPREWFHSRCGKDQETVGRTTIGGRAGIDRSLSRICQALRAAPGTQSAHGARDPVLYQWPDGASDRTCNFTRLSNQQCKSATSEHLLNSHLTNWTE